MFSQCRSKRVNCTHKAMCYMFSYFSQTVWGTILVCLWSLWKMPGKKKVILSLKCAFAHTHTHTHIHNIYSKILTLKFWCWSTLKGYWSLWKNSAFCINYLLLSMKKIKLCTRVCVYVGFGNGSSMETKMTCKSYLGIHMSFYSCIRILIMSKSIKKVQSTTAHVQLN